jgi:hypothetical protein
MLKADLDAVKLADGFGTLTGNTFVSIASTMVSDMLSNAVSNAVNAIAVGTGLEASDVGTDTTPPNVVSFTFDLNAGVINVSMSEPVEDTVNVTSVTLVSAADPAGYTLQAGSNVTLLDEQRLVQIVLSVNDLNAIKARSTLAVNASTTVLTVDSGFAADKRAAPVVPLYAANNTVASLFVPDTIKPSLVGFSLDLSTDQLTMVFSETVDGSTFTEGSVSVVGVSSGIGYTLSGVD